MRGYKKNAGSAQVETWIENKEKSTRVSDADVKMRNR
jgi:hypothetical protein